MKPILVWLLVLALIVGIAPSCSSSSSGSAVICGQVGDPCCTGNICAVGLACEGAVCASLGDGGTSSVSKDASSDASQHGDAKTKPKDASSEDSGPKCGALDEACCSGATCTGTLSCRSETCQNAPSNGTGTPCSKNSDCPSGICQPVGNGDVCTTTCNSVSDCVAGWTCASELGQSGKVCQCTPSTQACDGKDDDCDGIVDNEPAADEACEAVTPGFVCTNGTCRCKTMCGGTTCVDTTTDIGNCGSCGLTCPTRASCQSGTCTCPSGDVVSNTQCCPTGEISCSGVCVNEQTNSSNCGGCGTTCPAVQTCQSGSCACPVYGDALCGSACVNEQSDSNNCGRCGSACPTGGSCQRGTCACPSGDVVSNNQCCPTGKTSCNGTCVNEQSDSDNCGACGTTCQIRCVSGACWGATAIAAGGGTTCAVISDGTVECWGYDYNSTPEPVPGLSGVASIVVDDQYACALLSGGTVQCWGEVTSTSPMAVSGLSGVAAISAGGNACAVLSGGTVQCWEEVTSPSLMAVSNLSGATAVANAIDFACAILSGGGVVCWGSNGVGELGNGSTTNSSTPVAVLGLSYATAIAVGDLFACAIVSDGSVECWGTNTSGQLGNGTTTNSAVPVIVSGLTGVTAISARADTACAVVSGGTVECWGVEYSDGEYGYNSTPVAVSGLTGVTAVAVGYDSGNYGCAILSGGTVQCWGVNPSGELGNGGTTFSQTPVEVTGL